MAECHPVGFQWVLEARARGAKIVHIDPRFTRTSALADLYVPLRAGSDIAFLGGIVNYVLSEEKFFREYVLNYTNATTILTEDFADTEDLDGVFAGLDTEQRVYDYRAWRYEGWRSRPPRASGTWSTAMPLPALRSGRRLAARRMARAVPTSGPAHRGGTRR
jgi:formate dehydrogenase major subunit